MNSIAKFFITNEKLTIVLSIGLFVFGLMGLSKMNSESFPSVNFAQATVTTRYEGASAEDIETKITKKIEDEIRTVSGLKDVRSVSQPGFSSINIRADLDNIDVEKVMSDLQKAVDRVTGLPPDLEEAPKFLEIKSEEFPVIEIAITGSNVDRFRDSVADHLSDEIEDNEMVKDVRMSGFANRRFMINLDYQEMIEQHIGVDEVLAKVATRNVNIPGGTLKDIKTQSLVRVEGKIKNKEELENILVRSNFTGQSIYLKDIAHVQDDEEEITAKARYNGEEATLLIVSKKGGTDTIRLVNEVQKKLDQFKQLYGDKLNFNIYHNESTKVKDRLDVLASNAVSGLILVIVFLFIFLPGRIGMMTSLSLPLSVMATLGFMPMWGMNLNAITILALVIALGMLVDNSVVIAENYTRLRSEGQEPIEAATNSVSQLWLPITATAFTTIAAFMPMLVTKGIMGQFIKFIPIVVSFALLASLLESFLFLPMRLVHIGGKVRNLEEVGADWFGKVQTKFEGLMEWTIRRRYLVAGIFTISTLFAFVMTFKVNKFMLFPPEQTEVYIARVETPVGTRLEETSKLIQDLSVKIKDVLQDDALHIVGRAGTSQVQATDPKSKSGNNVGMITIYVSDNAKFNKTDAEVLKQLRTIEMKEFSELNFEAMINGPPVGNDIEGTFRSNSSSELNGLIGKIVTDLSKEPGVLNLKVDDVTGDDEIFVDINTVKADQLGLSLRSIGDTIRATIAGKIISNVTLDNKEVDLMVRFEEKDRANLTDLAKLEIMDGRGNLVPLGQVASFRREPGTPHIKRYEFKRAKTLTGNVDTTKSTPDKANKKLDELYRKYSMEYPSVSLVFGGVAESTKESMQSLFEALILSLIGIFALLVFLFRSYLRPFIIMTTIPLGLIGFSIAFFLHQRPVSFMALIGIIGLGGIIVNSGIVLISFIDDMKKEGKMDLHTILVKASGMRLRAVIVTSLTTISGLLPTAYGIGGNDALLIPMTMAMAWGLTSGTILTLVWVPPAYAILEDWTAFLANFSLKRKNKKNELSSALGAK